MFEMPVANTSTLSGNTVQIQICWCPGMELYSEGRLALHWGCSGTDWTTACAVD